MQERSRWMRFDVLFAPLLLAWFVVGHWLVPVVITDAYHGTSLSLLNNIVAGRTNHPLEFYLSAWSVMFRHTMLVLLGSWVLIHTVIKYRAALTSTWQRVVHGTPAMSAAELFAVALSFGALAGASEAASAAIRQTNALVPGFHWDLIWMAPLTAAFCFAVAGGILTLVTRAWRRRVALRVVVFLFACLWIYPLLKGFRLGLHPLAMLLLTIGIAAQLVRFTLARRDQFQRFVRRGAIVLPTIFVIAGITMAAAGKVSERFALMPRTSGAGLPNIVLIIWDAVRAEDLSLYGFRRPTTPNLQRIARTGVVFDRAIAPAPWTLPSHASLFTGLLPNEMSADFDTPLGAHRHTLAEELRDRGYETAAFVANLTYGSAWTGLNQGFIRYHDFPFSFEALGQSTTLSLDVIQLLRGNNKRDRYLLVRKTAADINEDVISWLSRRERERPFFAFLNYLDAHDPYLAHEPFSKRFSARAPLQPQIGAVNYTSQQRRELRDAYDANIAYLDHHLGVLLDRLEDGGVLDSTIVIIASDHGEQFGEHGLMMHANSLYLQLLHVPLIIRYPPRVPAMRRVAQTVSLRNIPATVMDLIGVSEASIFPGTSLARFWKSGGKPSQMADDPPILTVLSQKANLFSERTAPIKRGRMASLVSGDLHYIRNGDGTEELYELDSDPREEYDVSAAANMADTLEWFREQLVGAFAREKESAASRVR
jgi:arylsulfatase A-like enzyme